MFLLDEINVPLSISALEPILARGDGLDVSEMFDSVREMKVETVGDFSDFASSIQPQQRYQVADAADMRTLAGFAGVDMEARAACGLHENANRWTLKRVSGGIGNFLD